MAINKSLLAALTKVVKGAEITQDDKLAGWVKQEYLYKASEEEKPIHTTQHKGYYHHVFDSSGWSKPNLKYGADTRHLISKSSDPADEGLAMMFTIEGYSKFPMVLGSIVHPKHRSTGLGYLLYTAVIEYFGGLTSGHQLTKNANRVWEKLTKDSKYKTELSEYPGPGHHEVAARVCS